MLLEVTKHERNDQTVKKALMNNDFYITFAQCALTLNCFTYIEISLRKWTKNSFTLQNCNFLDVSGSQTVVARLTSVLPGVNPQDHPKPQKVLECLSAICALTRLPGEYAQVWEPLLCYRKVIEDSDLCMWQEDRTRWGMVRLFGTYWVCFWA